LFLNRVKPCALCYRAACQRRIALSRSPRTPSLPTGPRGRPVPPVNHSRPRRLRPAVRHCSVATPPAPGARGPMPAAQAVFHRARAPSLSPAPPHASPDSPGPPPLRSRRPHLNGNRAAAGRIHPPRHVFLLRSDAMPVVPLRLHL
jgi:hypothetical protein